VIKKFQKKNKERTVHWNVDVGVKRKEVLMASFG